MAGQPATFQYFVPIPGIRVRYSRLVPYLLPAAAMSAPLFRAMTSVVPATASEVAWLVSSVREADEAHHVQPALELKG